MLEPAFRGSWAHSVCRPGQVGHQWPDVTRARRSPSVGCHLGEPDDLLSSHRRAQLCKSANTSAKIQFGFYIVAWLCFVGAALWPSGRSGPRGLGRVDLAAFGLALAIAPSMYITFKTGFHKAAYFR